MADQEEDRQLSEAEILKLKEERDKSNALLAGVIFFMLLIIILWVINLGTIFKTPAKSSDQINIDQLTADFQKAFNQAGHGMSGLKQIDPAELDKYPLQTPPAAATIKK